MFLLCLYLHFCSVMKYFQIIVLFIMAILVVGFTLAYFFLVSDVAEQSRARVLSSVGLKQSSTDKDLSPHYEYSVEFEARPHPAIKPLRPHERATSAMSAKFRSLSPKPIRIWYDNGQEGTEQGHLSIGQETTTNTYVGHKFFFTDLHNPKHVLARHTMQANQVLYIIEDPAHPAPALLKQQTDSELGFMEEYFNRTGLLWRHYYGPEGPRPVPSLYRWPARQVGEVHRVTSYQGQWVCEGSRTECQSPSPITVDLEVISLQPLAFIISSILSDFEVDYIISQARPHMAHSSVGDTETGAFESDTRTSSNTWLSRSSSSIMDTLFRRAADIIQIPEEHLTRQTGAEDLQVVHYNVGQRYDAHHDWGVSGYPESRYLTLLLYLSDMEGEHAGGETAFPKAAGGKGMKVHAGKGSAVLFYNLLDDGNGDDLALHAALPVYQGEKWLANFWVWDPKFNK